MAIQSASARELGRSSQRSLHNAPIFRLLLKVAVNGTHQCDFNNFCGAVPQQIADWGNVECLLSSAKCALAVVGQVCASLRIRVTTLLPFFFVNLFFCSV